MEVLDKFFKKYSYKFDKGYPDMNNEQDILLLENILKDLNIILEISKVKIHTNAKEKIISSPEGKKSGLTQMSNPYRIGNRNKISSDEFVQIIKSIYPESKIEVLKVGEEGNKSRRFNLFKFQTEEGDVALYLAGGGNEGEKYEQNFVEAAKQGAGQPNNTLPLKLQTLYNSLGIDNTKLKPDDIKFEGGVDTKRSLSFEGPKDIGKTISDLTIVYEGQPYFISLKNKAGSGIYSGKNIPFIVYKDDKIIYDPSKDDTVPSINTFFNIFNIDREKVAQGLNNYVDQTGEPDTWSEVNIDDDKFEAFLASSIGYGYYYVRETKGDDVKVIPILTPQDALDAVGEITKAEIKYPGPTTKVVSVKLQANSPLFGNSQYDVVGRNAGGKILPLSFRIAKTK
mgnify:CR=1 FL=1